MGRISKNKQAPPTEVGKPQPEKRKAEGYVPRSGGKKLKLGPDGKKLKKAPAKKEAPAAPKKASKSKAVKSAEDLSVLISLSQAEFARTAASDGCDLALVHSDLRTSLLNRC